MKRLVIVKSIKKAARMAGDLGRLKAIQTVVTRRNVN
jgi:hypothetical protein